MHRFYWHSVAGRLAFLLVFEHLVFAIKGLISYFVPDVPGTIRVSRQREAFLSRQMLRSQEMDMDHV